jgi:hypothetical protein
MKAGTFTKVTVTQDGTITGTGYLQASDISNPLVDYNGTINSSELNTTTLNATTVNTANLGGIVNLTATGTVTANQVTSNTTVTAVSPNSGSSGAFVVRQNAGGGLGYIQFTNNGMTSQFAAISADAAGNLGLSPASGTTSCSGGLNASGDIRANTGGADGGTTLRPWTANAGYSSVATANMTGQEYMIITDGNDTFISGGSGGSTHLRGGANSTAAQVQVTTSAVNITGNATMVNGQLDTNVVSGNDTIQTVTNAGAGAGFRVRQPSGNGSSAIIQFTDFGITDQRASISADSSRNLILSSTRAYWGAVYNNLVAGSANVQASSDSQLRRITSSGKYKKDVEGLDHEVADRVLDLRPVWFRAKENNTDNPEQWSYVGLIAEEVAEVEPRLVFYKTVDPVLDEHGNMVMGEDGEPELKILDTPEPESVQYDKIAVYLLDVVKREKARSDDLEQRIIALEKLVASLV